MKLTRITTYYKIWRIFATTALQETFVNRGAHVLFFTGKAIRFSMSLLFLYLIKQNITTFAGYTASQMIVFFLTYQFVDVFSQVLFRGVYLFSNLIRTGDFDFLLCRPVSPLFCALVGKPDINDALFLIPTTAVSIYIFSTLGISVTLQTFLLYCVLLLNSLLIALSLHILILVIGILTTQVDGVVWIYRDVSYLGRFPVTMYLQPLRFLLFFIVPIGIMTTIPTQILIGTQPTYSIFISCLVGVTSIVTSTWLWKQALMRYTSASS